MTKTMTILALICFLVVGAAATAIIGRDGLPAMAPQLAADSAAAVQAPVSNKANKKDRLAVVSYALAAYEPPQTTAALGEPLRQAYALGRTPPISGCRRKLHRPRRWRPPHPRLPRRRSPRPSPSRTAPQKNYALLSDGQIAGIKDRLKLSSSQESYWPPVENALRAVARKIHAGRQANPNAPGVPIDPESAEVQQLKSAAMPLLFQLREDQKSEVRSLARIIGLEKVAAMI